MVLNIYYNNSENNICIVKNKLNNKNYTFVSTVDLIDSKLVFSDIILSTKILMQTNTSLDLIKKKLIKTI